MLEWQANMSFAQAEEYIRRLRAVVPLRRQFELVWQGKRRNPDDVYLIEGEPVVPRLLASSIPDNKTDPSGYQRWWSMNRAQQDMHDLLFSKGDGHDHAQRYLDGEMITDARILQVIDEPDMEEALDLLARIANACADYDISLADMKAAWHGYVQWIYNKTDYAEPQPEVRRLRKDALDNAALRSCVNDIASLKTMPTGVAVALQGYLQSGFASEGAYESFEAHKVWLQAVATAAKEAGYDFTALDYLKDCISKQGEDDPGPELDDRYWPEDDPNRWNYESPPVRFGL